MKKLKQLVQCAAVTGLLMLGSACTVMDPVTGQQVYNWYSLDEEIELGRSFLAQNTDEMIKENVPVDHDPVRMNQLNDMIRRLSAVSDLPDLPYNVKLYGSEIVNAAAAPGGSMMVFEGLYGPEGLVRPDDENELAAVMAHEIAHVNCRHVTEQLSRVQTAGALATIGALVAEAEDEPEVAALIEGLFVVGTALWIPSYSRGHEAEADRVGLFYMAAAGYDPRAAPRIWKRAWEKSGEDGGGFLDFFNTHPADRQRWQNLEQILPYAIEVYAQSTGKYPEGWEVPPGFRWDPNFNWRLHEE